MYNKIPPVNLGIRPHQKTGGTMFKNITQDKDLSNKGAQFLLRQSGKYLQGLENALDGQIDNRDKDDYCFPNFGSESFIPE